MCEGLFCCDSYVCIKVQHPFQQIYSWIRPQIYCFKAYRVASFCTFSGKWMQEGGVVFVLFLLNVTCLNPNLTWKLSVLPLTREKIFSLFCRLGESLKTKFSDDSGSVDDIHRNRSPKSYKMTHPVGQITKRLPGCNSISGSPFPQPSLILTSLTPLGEREALPKPHWTLGL